MYDKLYFLHNVWFYVCTFARWVSIYICSSRASAIDEVSYAGGGGGYAGGRMVEDDRLTSETGCQLMRACSCYVYPCPTPIPFLATRASYSSARPKTALMH